MSSESMVTDMKSPPKAKKSAIDPFGSMALLSLKSYLYLYFRIAGEACQKGSTRLEASLSSIII
jgi:hypothetical protein